MGLKTYFQKRNFTETKEPKGKIKHSKGDLKFVIQRHAASHLHYDFRLEMEGVLKSWAVPKGPSLNPKDKRLAMMVEDHPFDYRTFEGVIPEGNYGAGIVEIWDEGTFQCLGIEDREKGEKELLKQLKKGSVKVVMNGKKLKGEFALVKLKKDDKSWLLIKHNDEFATHEGYTAEEHVPKNSPINKKLREKSRRPEVKKSPIVEEQDEIAPGELKGARKSKIFHEIKPMLTRIKEEPFDSKDWIFEIKWDGYRAISEINKGKVKLYSRNGLGFEGKYPIITEALKEIDHDVILDGEIVVVDKAGQPSFQAIQQYNGKSENIFYYIFDILYCDGYDLTRVPLRERKQFLKNIIPYGSEFLRFSDHIEEEGTYLFQEMQKKKMEGIIAKKADSFYHMNSRSSDWLKIKAKFQQEAVICGYTAPRGSRKGFGALILGVYENEKLVYVGHSGGGFTEKGIKELKAKFDKTEISKSPFDQKIKPNQPVTWVKPQMVCEVEFTEWTSDGLIRHPIYKGIRPDKKAKEVYREVEEKKKETSTRKKKSTSKKSESNNEEIPIGSKVQLSNLNKVFWPEEGYTKGDVIRYYQSMAKYILPYLKNRPESLHRHPHGIHSKGFYHKDIGDTTPPWIETFKVDSETPNGYTNYMLCQDAAALAYMNNLGCIEINPWNSRIKKPEHPDYLIVDLDPSTDNFEEVIDAARAVKEVMDRAGIQGYCKTSGASGLHIYIPMGAKYDYDHVKEFAHLLVVLVNQLLPDTTTIERNVRSRGKKIYLDYLQNRRGQTLASVYSLRPHPGATVSTPLDWKEVKSGLHPSQFNIENILKRVEKKGDLFLPVLGKGIDMVKCIKKLDR